MKFLNDFELAELESRPDPASDGALMYYYNGNVEVLLPDTTVIVLGSIPPAPTPDGLNPAGGTTDQVLKKASNADYDYTWQDEAINGLPNGGFVGQILEKASGTSYDVQWVNKQFTEAQQIALLQLIFNYGTVSLTRSPSTFEKNLSAGTDVTYNYSFTANDDTFVSATFNGGSVTASGSEIINTKVTNSETYAVTMQQQIFDAIPRVISARATATAYEPQYYGVSSTATYAGASYATLGADLTKFLQSGDNRTIVVSPSNEYVYFLSINNSATILDGNGFDNTSDFTMTPITVDYEDGTSQTLYQYRTNSTKTLSNFTYSLS